MFFKIKRIRCCCSLTLTKCPMRTITSTRNSCPGRYGFCSGSGFYYCKFKGAKLYFNGPSINFTVFRDFDQCQFFTIQKIKLYKGKISISNGPNNIKLQFIQQYQTVQAYLQDLVEIQCQYYFQCQYQKQKFFSFMKNCCNKCWRDFKEF